MLLAVVLAVGCDSGPKRVDVRGKVTFDGKPVPEGEIRFIPVGPNAGPAAGGSIVQGKYEVGGKGGVSVGKNRVEITAYRVPAGVKPDPNVPFVPKEQYLPEKYNTQSTLEFAVPGGPGPLTKDFDLPP
jgi:hypothetical protein